MTDFNDEALAAIEEFFAAFGPTPITYTQGGTGVVITDAIKRETTRTPEDAGMDLEIVTFMIRGKNLSDGGIVTPSPGDTILDGTRLYEVAPGGSVRSFGQGALFALDVTRRPQRGAT